MTPAKDIDRQVARLARVTDEQLIECDRSPAARDLLAAIVSDRSDPVRQRRSAGRPVRRFALAAASAGVMAVAIVLGPVVLPDGAGTATSYANEAIEIRKEGGEFIARIKDPLADSSRYEKGFAAVGRDVEIVLVPVPPAMVGMLLETDGGGSMRVTSRQDCATASGPCNLVIRVSANGDGRVRQTIGRAAQPGEKYQVPGSAEPQRSTGTTGGSGD
ncbi:hypothetical protein [Actinoplanes sp. NPDC049118]|uniref:hypothetical protein n=1 Tax=Actinoplanes sp. NPDC049118 TaxID=3155769 RepID=UPI0033D698EE